MNEKIDKKRTEEITETNRYSWNLTTWWNLNWSYDRIQYYNEEVIINFSEITSLITQWIVHLKENETKTRLDIRIKTSKELITNLEKLKKIFWNIDISIKKFYQDNNFDIIIWKNSKEREVSEKEIETIKSYIKSKIYITLDYINKQEGFEKYALKKLSNIIKEWYKFENTNFKTEEILELWNDSFWWNKESVQSLLDNHKDNIYWLRNKKWELISSILISNWETTEWATKKNYQWKWLIEPLLIYANSSYIKKVWQNKSKIYVQARYNRSIWPSIKSWMNFILCNNLQYILTNHVEIEWEYQNFVEWVLDTSQYSEKIIKSYLNIN